MKTKQFRLSLFIITLGFGIIFCGCQDSTSVVDPKKGTEVVLQNYRLTDNETWEPEKTYIVQGTLEIPPNVVLEVPPGTVIKFNRDALITVRGMLKIGTPLLQVGLDGPVLLTSNDSNPEPGDWQGILFDHTHDIESYLRGAIIEYADVALDIRTASPNIMDCTLRHNQTAITLDGSNSKTQYNTIHDNEIGINTLGRQNRPRIEYNNFTNNNVGIWCENVQSIIEFNNFEKNGYAFRLNVKFQMWLPNNWWGTIINNEIDKIILDGQDTDIITKVLGIVAYDPIVETRIEDAGPRE